MKSINPVDGSFKDLMIKFLKGNTSLWEEKLLRKWMSESKENSELFEYYRLLWLGTAANTARSIKEEEQEWKKLEAIMSNTLENKQKEVSVKSNFSFTYLFKIAAVFVVVFLSGFYCSQFMSGFLNKKATSNCEIITPLGSKTFLNLPDGSQVWLNAGSKLKYSKSFDETIRRVHLQGEAYFKVKSDKKRPFIVSTDKVDVKALGTSFNVKAYPDERYVSATLVEGIIKVDGTGSNKFSYTLKPKQNITILKQNENLAKVSKNTKQKNPESNLNKLKSKTNVLLDNKVNTEIYTSWKDSLWTIKGEPLSSLAVLFERKYNVKIHIESKELYTYKFTGTIRNETFEQVLQFLRYTTPVKYSIGKGEAWWNLDPVLAEKYSKILDKKIH